MQTVTTHSVLKVSEYSDKAFSEINTEKTMNCQETENQQNHVPKDPNTKVDIFVERDSEQD